MLQLVFTAAGARRAVPLTGSRLVLGRDPAVDVPLPDPSVSRRHAELRRLEGRWVIEDLASTNGVEVNGAMVRRVYLAAGDRLRLGDLELAVEELLEAGDETVSGDTKTRIAMPPPAAEPPSGIAAGEVKATFVRRVDELSAPWEELEATDGEGARLAKRQVLDQAYDNRIFGFLLRLGGHLMRADSVDEVLRRVMEVAFEVLPADRGFLFLENDEGELACALARFGEQVEIAPALELPISRTLLQRVIDQRLALVTDDAVSDERLAAGESILAHRIRSAMCAPLWSGEEILGIIQIDTPFQVGVFTPRDLDLLTALANYAAVAVERLQNADSAERERRLRARLERYHSPSVVEEVLRRREPGEGAPRPLDAAEVTVLFADLAGFTPFAEQAPPQEVAAFLNRYFNHAVEAIFNAGGTLDKFLGDGVMAFFGAPVRQEDHAERAVSAAVALRRAMGELNAERQRDELPQLPVRLALESGPVVVGEVGSEQRVDYTVLGNTVNIAARLEKTVAGPGEIVLGPETRRQLPAEVVTEELGEVRLEGLARPLKVYRVAQD